MGRCGWGALQGQALDELLQLGRQAAGCAPVGAGLAGQSGQPLCPVAGNPRAQGPEGAVLVLSQRPERDTLFEERPQDGEPFRGAGTLVCAQASQGGWVSHPCYASLTRHATASSKSRAPGLV
jgi:hypothetical protein